MAQKNIEIQKKNGLNILLHNENLEIYQKGNELTIGNCIVQVSEGDKCLTDLILFQNDVRELIVIVEV